MRLKLIRSYFTEISTVGELYADGQFICYTLEDKVREVKIQDVTAIPAGTYPVQITWSNKFAQMMPLVMNVPNYTGIRIHWGNTAENTSGCLLVGLDREQDRILRSREAYAKVYALIAQAGGATITIENRINKAKGAGALFAALLALTATAALWEQEQKN